MTLRLRLTLLIALVVALVLAGSGVSLHLLLRASLYRGLDESLAQAMSLLSGFVETDRGDAELEPEGEPPPQLRSDLTALLIDAEGEVRTRIGARPEIVPEPRIGYSTQGDARVLTRRIADVTLLVMREQDQVEDSLERFDASFLALAPIALVVALGLGYLVAGRGLAPVDRLTRAALELAQRQAWRERLPEPERQDELWRLASATNRLLAALAQVIERERRFTADAAHELRTPLTVLQGRLEQADEAAGGEVKLLLGKALAANQGLLELIERLLVLARAEAGQQPPGSVVALDELAFDAAEQLRPAFERKGLLLELHLPEASAWVRGDAAALALVIRNLLENALKFAPEGRVMLRVREREGCLRLSVEDEGPGIPEQALPQLFDRFYQADVRHRRQGSGLGLALVKSVVDWHGGRVGAENRRAGGARLWFELPRAALAGA